MTDTSNEIRSEIASDGNLKISLESVNKPEPKDGEVLIKIEASPINPSDLGLLLGPADVSTLKVSDGVAQMKVPDALMRSVSARLDQSLPVGNEGAGVVESAGKGAEDLVGKVVGVAGGSMYSNYRCLPASACLVMNEGTTSKESASCFVNPLTALGMVETMKMENHTALVHTAAYGAPHVQQRRPHRRLLPAPHVYRGRPQAPRHIQRPHPRRRRPRGRHGRHG